MHSAATTQLSLWVSVELDDAEQARVWDRVDLHSLGQQLISDLSHRRSIGARVLRGRSLLTTAAAIDVAGLSVGEAVALAVSHLHGVDDWALTTANRMGGEIGRFGVFLEHHGVDLLSAASVGHVDAFVRGGTSARGGWREPSINTMHLRLSAVRLVYRCLRALHVRMLDPTLEVRLPARTSGRRTRALTDEEELICRLTSEHTLTETRRPLAWALGQATATTTEQAAIVVSDVDLDGRRVWLHGSSKRTPRWGELTDWGLAVVSRAVRTSASVDSGLVYGARWSTESGTASVCRAMSQVLGDAGYAMQSDVRPGSLTAWAGRRLFEQDPRIEVVALRLGLRSLDTAADTIGLDWSQ